MFAFGSEESVWRVDVLFGAVIWEEGSSDTWERGEMACWLGVKEKSVSRKGGRRDWSSIG